MDNEIMRYILNDDGYIDKFYFGCYGDNCTAYTGNVPSGYSSIIEWLDNAIIGAYKLDEDGNLILDTIREAYLKALYDEEEKASGYATKDYVNSRVNSSTSVITDEISKNATGTGFLILNDAGAYEIPKIKILSEITESVFIKTSNKNLLGNDLVNAEINGVSVSVNEDKTITLNGTATSDIELNLWANNNSSEMLFLIKKELDYYLSGLNDLELCFYAKNDDGLDLVYKGSNGLINLDEDKIITYVTLIIKNETTFKNLVISPQLELNNEATDYISHEETKKTALDETIENELKSYEDFTIIMLDNDLEFSIDYFTKKYFNNKFAEISTNIDEISLKTASNSENIDGIVESIDKLVLTTDGLTNTLENRGGNNLIRNSYFCEFENGLLTFWSGPQKVVEKYESKSRNALSLQNGTLTQVISLTNKKYCFSFKYIKLTQVANAKVLVNNKEIVLDSDIDFENYIEFVADLKSDSITIEFICDTNDGFLIYEPMLNEGDTASVFTQNASESISDTVNIGKGIEVLASNINNKTRIDADGIRGINTETNEATFYQTTEGIYGKELETESIRSGNLIVTTRNGHNFLSGL